MDSEITPESQNTNRESQFIDKDQAGEGEPVTRAAPKHNEFPPVPEAGKTSNFGKNLWRTIVFIFNIILIFIFVSAISAGIYFGWPVIYQGYIQPIGENTANISQLQKKIADSNSQIAIVQTQAVELNNSQAGIILTLSAVNSKQESMQTAIDQQTSSIKSIEDLQKSLTVSNQDSDKKMNSKLNQMLSMEYLSRARLFLYQSNFGLAKNDIQQARNTLSSIENLSAPENSLLVEVIQRLDLCLSRLPDYPVPASGDLDIAWQLLGTGNAPINTSAAVFPVITATFAPTLEFSSTPEPAIAATPTP
ncbi:MAG: hypothetical protein WCP19_10350 [Chloroflexota bacterium]